MTFFLKKWFHKKPLRELEVLESFSQDLRKPLYRIVSASRFLMNSQLSPDQLSDLARLQAATDHTLSLINELYDFSRLHEGTLELDKITFSLRGSLRKMIMWLQYAARDRNIVLDFDIDPAVPDALTGDPVRLRQIIENIGSEIIENTFRLPLAKPFSGSGMRGGIRADSLDDRFVLLHIFFEGDEGFPSIREGLQFQVATGLVKLMGGRLWQETRGEGHTSGIHVVLSLPLQSLPAPLDGRISVDMSSLRALIVDHDSVERTLLQHALVGKKITTRVTADSEEALTLIAEADGSGEPYDLIFLEHLQEDGAFRLVERLRDCDLAHRAAIFLVVAHGRRGDAIRCRQLGIAGFFVKPVPPNDLFEAISLTRSSLSEGGKSTLPLITKHFLDEEDRRLKILYADRDPSKQKDAARLLEFQGHQVRTATSGDSVLSLLERENFDLILMDPKISDTDGIETTSRIRERERQTGTHTPIVGMATSMEQEEKKRCLDAGMDIYVVQPLHSSRFTEVIRNLGLD